MIASRAAASRDAAVRQLSTERFDVLVVGGGITGVGIALDAATRGLRTALVERDDIAGGTSSRSSKLIHGGLRYLEQRQFGLVRQALAERRRLLRLAPHLVRIEPFLLPIYGSPLWLGYVGAGLMLYDLLGARHDGGRTRFLTPGATRRLAPQLRARGLTGGLLYHDGVEDDARLAVAVARTAVREGATVTTRTSATAPLVADGQVIGARVRDELGGAEFDVLAGAVIDATGPTGGFEPGAVSPAVVPSRGSHVMIPRDRLHLEHGMTLWLDGRVVFVIPWGDCWIVGTTDVPHDGAMDRPSATPEEVTYLVDRLAEVLDVRLGPADIVATYAGVRPLAARGSGRSTLQVSREHRIDRSPEGIVRVRGGKYTTYRLMAAEAVDRAVAPERAGTSRTAEMSVVGALADADRPEARRVLRERHGLDDRHAEHLLRRFGSEAPAVADLGQELGLLRPLVPGRPYLEAEVAWGARHELAVSVDDILARRTRIAIETDDHGAGAAPRVAAILGAELGWSEDRMLAAAAAYGAIAEREYGAVRPVSSPIALGSLAAQEVTG